MRAKAERVADYASEEQDTLEASELALHILEATKSDCETSQEVNELEFRIQAVHRAVKDLLNGTWNPEITKGVIDYLLTH